MRKLIGAMLAVGMLSASCGTSTDADRSVAAGVSAASSQPPTSLPFVAEEVSAPEAEPLARTSRNLQEPVVRDDAPAPQAEPLKETTLDIEESPTDEDAPAPQAKPLDPTGLSVDDLLDALADATAGQSAITLVVSGEFEGRSYTTTETVISDPEQSRTYVQVDHSEFAEIIDYITPKVLEAQEQSESDSQSFGTTLVLVLGLSEDRGEYLIDGTSRWQLAAGSPDFLSTMRQLTLGSNGEFSEEDALEFGESLAGKWLQTEVNENAAPSFLGIGELLPQWIEHNLVEAGVDESLQIVGQRSENGSTILETETTFGQQILFELDESGELRGVEFDIRSGFLGNPETYSVMFGEFESGLLATPPADLQLSEEELLELTIEHLETNFPEVFEAARQQTT